MTVAALNDPAKPAAHEQRIYEEELATALRSAEIRPWLDEGLIDEGTLRAAAIEPNAVREAFATVADEYARLQRLSDRISELHAELSRYRRRIPDWVVGVTAAVAVLGIPVTVIWAGQVTRLLYMIVVVAVLSLAASQLTGFVGTREHPTLDEMIRANELTEVKRQLIAKEKALRRQLRATMDERAAAESEWRSALRERAIVPLLRLAVNETLDGGSSTTLVVRDRRGLGSTPDPARTIDTTAAPRVRRLIEEMSRATIAVAGPHGVGKSTLLRAVCAGRYTRPGEPPDLAVSVAAPVGYVPREFLLTLFAVVCRAVLADQGREAPPPAVPVPGRRRGQALARIPPLLPPVCGAALLLWRWWDEGVRTARHHAPWIGAGLLAGSLVWWLTTGVRRRRVPPDAALGDRAVEHLIRLHTVRSIARGNTGTAALPLGATTQLTRTLTVTTQTPTYPELVGEFRGFLAELAAHLRGHGRRLIIAIDEVDRIGSKAPEFLQELKAVFGVPNCFFLVSVADDLATGFAGRATPAVDSLESAFDELVRMNFLTWRESRDLLQRRVIGLPTPYALLCHILSGGVARELIRTTRRLLWTYDARSVSDLPSLAMAVADEDLAERIDAARSAACLTSGSSDPGDGRDALLRELDDAEREIRRADERGWRAARLRLAAPRQWPDDAQDSRTRWESIAARAYLHVTAVELLTTWAGDGLSPSAHPQDVEELATLARLCTTAPALTHRRLDELRQRHALAPAVPDARP
ncbi:hypothetical protein NE235_02515 [Actinoallomurus spadix]|uniref:AAA+ ATPase domain-containing protein n=1 Tax=Actinoallomurus spadix TaxID=79912 RepID=A0ABP3HDR8_9ACTN|nr:hypothetical protein [Actinoallomurus spadix]MCO5984975.1 hypothetical protein [Actinoallomurus spadix]